MIISSSVRSREEKKGTRDRSQLIRKRKTLNESSRNPDNLNSYIWQKKVRYRKQKSGQISAYIYISATTTTYIPHHHRMNVVVVVVVQSHPQLTKVGTHPDGQPNRPKATQRRQQQTHQKSRPNTYASMQGYHYCLPDRSQKKWITEFVRHNFPALNVCVCVFSSPRSLHPEIIDACRKHR